MTQEVMASLHPSTYGKDHAQKHSSFFEEVENSDLEVVTEDVAATTSNMEDELTNEVQSPPNPQKRISGKQRKATLEEYQQTFLQVPRIDDRKPVFVSSDVRDRLDRVVRILGGRRMSVSGIIENIVVDPVMVATSGAKLLRDDAVEALCRELLPLAAVLTPNIPEAEILSGMTITDATGMEAAAKYISEKYGCAVLCKGGHKVNDADDLLWRNGFGKWFHGKRIDNPNTHGTGCTLSSAIASNLAKGYDLDESVERAKEYISGALAAMLDLGHGSGPMNHMFALKGAFTE